jgi:hypothetical protein
MYLKRHVRRKDGKSHVYYSLSESVRIGRDRVVQRRLLNLAELNTTQIDRWHRSIEVIEEDGQARQRRLFSDREGRPFLPESVSQPTRTPILGSNTSSEPLQPIRHRQNLVSRRDSREPKRTDARWFFPMSSFSSASR